MVASTAERFGRRRLPVLLQTEASECGLICLAMLAAYHGNRTDTHELRRRLGATARGWSLRTLIGGAATLGFSARALRVEIDDLRRVVCPAILHWDFDHFVVLKRVGARYAIIHNPAVGERRFPLSELSRHFTGVALELTPTAAFERTAPPPRLSLWTFWRDAEGLGRPIVQLLGLSTLIQLFALATPSYMQVVVDDVLVKRDVDVLNVLAIGFLLIALINVATKALRGWVTLYLANQLNFSIGVRLFFHLIRLPLDYFQRRHVGDVVSRFRSLKPVQEFITGGVVAAVIDGAMALTTLVVIVIYSPLLACIALGAFAAYATLRALLFQPLRRRSQEAIAADARLDSNFLETIRTLQGIKLFGKESERERTWQDLFVESVNASARVGRLNLGYDALSGTLLGIESVLTVYVGAQQVLAGALTIGMLYAFIAYRTHFSNAMNSLIAQVVQGRMLALHLERISDIALAEQEPGLIAESAFVAPLRGALSLERLCFAYSRDDPPLIRDLDLRIEPGQRIAIVGPSGVGKSTLMRLMLGLIRPTSGCIAIDGIPLDRFGIRSYRAGVAALLQDDALLSGSIRDNVSFFDLGVDATKLERAMKIAQIYDDVTRLPMGFDSRIGDMGSALSAGQQQRLLLARALYREPSILFLDEATSHLDCATELAIMRSIAALGITCIYTTHRDTVAQFADKVLSLGSDGWQLRDESGATSNT
jgi:ATP-binding cassette, subfamily B, bacterial CvaB/MchF/RaxB